MGAACVAQSAKDKLLSREMAEDLLGLCSFCGPSFLFGVIGNVLSLTEAAVLFVIQLETALLIAVFRRRSAPGVFRSGAEAVSLPQAVRRAISSIATVCAWVVLAGVAAGFLRRWLFPLLPKSLGIFMTGILELTNGIFALEELPPSLRLPFCAFFVIFGGAPAVQDQSRHGEKQAGGGSFSQIRSPRESLCPAAEHRLSRGEMHERLETAAFCRCRRAAAPDVGGALRE